MTQIPSGSVRALAYLRQVCSPAKNNSLILQAQNSWPRLTVTRISDFRACILRGAGLIGLRQVRISPRSGSCRLWKLIAFWGRLLRCQSGSPVFVRSNIYYKPGSQRDAPYSNSIYFLLWKILFGNSCDCRRVGRPQCCWCVCFIDSLERGGSMIEWKCDKIRREGCPWRGISVCSCQEVGIIGTGTMQGRLMNIMRPKIVPCTCRFILNIYPAH